MKVLLSTLNSKYIHTALSLRYLKYYCEEFSKVKVDIKEYTINQNINYIIGEIYRYKPDVLAFSVYIWNIKEIMTISEAIKLLLPNIKIMLGGPEVSFEIEKLLLEHPFIDMVIYGEGEIAFKETLEKLEKGESIKEADGIAYRESERIIVNPKSRALQDLSLMPAVYRDDLEQYENKIIYYESTRGCPFNCNFCLSSTIQGVRFFPLERVKEDLKKFLDAGVKQVKFIDRTFNANKNHALEILKFISENDNNYTNFHFEITAHLLDEELMEFLSEMPNGLVQFEIGVQSTNTQTVESINRTTDFEKLSNVVKRISQRANIHLHLDLIAGLPYETYESFKSSFNDVYRLKPEKLQLGFLKLLKGSKIREEAKIHDFKFLNKAPYEVLENKYISYGEILKLKDIEELVEIYGNEKDFEKSLEFLLRKYEDPFSLYEDFSDYWRQYNYYESPHSKVEQYRILLDFFKAKYKEETRIFREILRFDFIRNTKSPNVPLFLGGKELELSKQEKTIFLKSEKTRQKYFKDILDKDYNKLHKVLHFESFNYDVMQNIEKRTVYLFNYDLNKREIEKSYIFDITKELEGEIECLE